MSDAISIPSEIKFKEMLSHTFPGFFLAISIFMGIDYLSPVNYTDWAMGSLTGMISFVGFIILMGTIFGIIIDGIHHTFIEDDIFDNFESVHRLKKPIEMQLKFNCPAYCDLLSRHFFFSKIGEKGSNATVLEGHLDEAYYRYSEFYSNVFVSLLVFSIISPFYIFEVLELSWIASISIGIVSLLVACLCLISSYTSYNTYLQAQSSAICGFIKGTESGCILNCKTQSNKKINYHPSYIIIIMISLIPAIFIWSIVNEYCFIALIVINLIIASIIDKNILKSYLWHKENSDHKKCEEFAHAKNGFEEIVTNVSNAKDLLEKSAAIFSKDKDKAEVQIKNIDKLVNYAKYLTKTLDDICASNGSAPDLKETLSKLSPIALISFISGVLISMVILACVYIPVNLNIEPMSINFSENITDNGSIKNPIVTLSLKNLGAELNEIKLTANGIEKNWLEFTYVDDRGTIINESKNITVSNIATEETLFVRIKLNSTTIDKNDTSPGSYAGSIDIDYGNKKQSIPVRIDLTKKNPPLSQSKSG